MGQAITNPISGPSFDFTFTIGPELDNIIPSTLERHTILLASMNITLANYNQQGNLYLVIIKEING